MRCRGLKKQGTLNRPRSVDQAAELVADNASVDDLSKRKTENNAFQYFRNRQCIMNRRHDDFGFWKEKVLSKVARAVSSRGRPKN